ncbi:hypothetical protein NDU88_003981 [Pleurodeles waltl]|uniref:Uncharacterized protein n=1 Tax=Pleurodeles waltl TaxID=8319 RepID=A0AAV7QGE2_PLEWA|nr:hypothetical protein NDU88_003981 [Pleurodeles waltl]
MIVTGWRGLVGPSSELCPAARVSVCSRRGSDYASDHASLYFYSSGPEATEQTINTLEEMKTLRKHPGIPPSPLHKLTPPIYYRVSDGRLHHRPATLQALPTLQSSQ